MLAAVCWSTFLQTIQKSLFKDQFYDYAAQTIFNFDDVWNVNLIVVYTSSVSISVLLWKMTNIWGEKKNLVGFEKKIVNF